MSLPLNPPAIILVRPQLGMNIGAVARAMLNFGLTELRLVQPRDGWPNPDAGPSAAGADKVIENARVFDGVAEAIADCHLTIGTAQTTRDMVRRVTSPAGCVAELQALPGKSALLFGPERTGLVREDLLKCHAICTIPTTEHFSLNVAQACLLGLYELHVLADDATKAIPAPRHKSPAPTKDEYEMTFADMQRALEGIAYFKTRNEELMMRSFRS